MEAEILGHDEDAIGVEVYDPNVRHIVNVQWDGEIEKHTVSEGSYPHSPEDRTLEEQRIMTQVEERAKLEAQQEFPDADILEADWTLSGMDRAIQALQAMDVDEFAAEFEECYQFLTDPASIPEVPEGSADILYQPFLVDENDDVAYVPTPALQYVVDGDVRMTDRESKYERLVDDPSLTRFTIMLPPMEFEEGAYEFPDGFQVFLIEHLGAQVRDLYRHVGEEPPEPWSDIDLPGRPLTAADEEFYDEWKELKDDADSGWL